MKNTTAILVFLLLLSAGNFLSVTDTMAQPYVKGGKTRFRFAQLNIGLDNRLFINSGSESSAFNSAGEIETFRLKNQDEIRLVVGGTHFWGHADFYVAFPLETFGESGFSTEIELGARYYPWRIQSGKLRPYIGTAILTSKYKQGNGAGQIRNLYPLTGGVVFNYKQHLFELGAGYIFNNRESYYISTETAVKIKTQPFWVSLGYKFMIDVTLPEEKDWMNGKTKRVTDSLKALHRLSGITLAIGPSASFFLRKSPHNDEAIPYVGDHKISDVFPEFGLGYYWCKPDLQFNLAYRNIKSTIEAYDFRQQATRKSLSFEVYKFFFDYNGFDPYIGPVVGYEWLEVKETDPSRVTTVRTWQGIRPGITFGWEIRPNQLMFLYLRSNLRYFPNLTVKMGDGKDVFLDQLEFDFFQVVIFPQRIGIRD